jgi:hypothetical protein
MPQSSCHGPTAWRCCGFSLQSMLCCGRIPEPSGQGGREKGSRSDRSQSETGLAPGGEHPKSNALKVLQQEGLGDHVLYLRIYQVISVAS